MELDAQGIRQFGDAVERLPGLLQELTAAPRHQIGEIRDIPNVPGIYLFAENGWPIYVGQSRKLKQRLRNHTRLSARQNQASFAFNLCQAGRR